MGLLSVILALLVALIAVLLWRRRAYETVDFSDSAARRQSAARWMANGESAEAEAMMREAVGVLEGWPRALAHGDLASVLMASQRAEEAIQELKAACQLASGAPAEQDELLEMRIRWARLLADSGRATEAEQVLLDAAPKGDSPLDAALAGEALGEFYLQENRAAEAVATLRPALATLAQEQCDRAASAAVTLAFALQGSDAASPWQSLEPLAADLKSGAVVNFCDRRSELGPEAADALLRSLLALLRDWGGFARECEELAGLISD